MDTATKTGLDAAKTTSKRVLQETAEATCELIENKIADKAIHQARQKVKKTKMKDKKLQQIIDDLRSYKNGIVKDYKLVKHNILIMDNVPGILLKMEYY